MHFFRDNRVSTVLMYRMYCMPGLQEQNLAKSSCNICTLRFYARHFLVLTKKLLFLEAALT